MGRASQSGKTKERRAVGGAGPVCAGGAKKWKVLVQGAR